MCIYDNVTSFQIQNESQIIFWIGDKCNGIKWNASDSSSASVSINIGS